MSMWNSRTRNGKKYEFRNTIELIIKTI